ncbi:MAG TPA: TonB-dependent receptor [Vicinamibacteria bacterium]|nr:TonB-dependent receptor [Vicinamibacteria bacterium]
MRHLLWSVVLLLACAALTPAATETGVVEGVVKDASGAVLPGATVTATGPVTRSERSSALGAFRIAGLPPGSYVLTANRPGFAETRSPAVPVGAEATPPVELVLTAAANERVVVSADRGNESNLIDAPATVSVVTGSQIAASSAQNFGDMLRSVTGLNVVQSSARDINLAARQASPLLTNTQLALVDGRTIYADFFNIVFWDLIPTDPDDIKQIEVVRGPASAMWGANAVTGVVNIVTKSPREAPGGTISVTGGGFSRDVGSTVGEGPGAVFGVNASFAQAPNERWAYRASAGYFDSQALPRPTGTLPIATSPLDPTLTVGGGSFDQVAYTNEGTKQPKLDLRVDQQLANGGRISYSAGLATSQGIILSPIGPFDLEKASRFGYGRVAYDKGGFRLSGFANLINGKAPNLITVDATGQPLRIDFNTGTYDLDAGWTRLLGSRHAINVGGNLRENTFDISLAPDAKDRTELGAYVQDDIFLSRQWRLALSARVDKFSSLADPFFSPRAALIFKPTPEHSLKLSVNRGFRAPSAIDNYLDITIVGGVLPLDQILPGSGLQPFPVVTRTVGNPDLVPESHLAYEAGYQGTFGGRTSVGVSFYLNDTDHVISSAQAAQTEALLGYNPYYTSQNPPPGWPLPPEMIDLLAQQGVQLPAIVKTVNLGKLRNKGFEAQVQHSFQPGVTAYANYSYQALPEIRTAPTDPLYIPPVSVSVPPKNRFNLGLTVDRSRWLGSLAVCHADKAFFTDVLDERYYGYADAYTLVNAALGARWQDGHVTTSLKASNLLNDDIRQHNFGDYLKRTLLAELRFSF